MWYKMCDFGMHVLCDNSRYVIVLFGIGIAGVRLLYDIGIVGYAYPVFWIVEWIEVLWYDVMWNELFLMWYDMMCIGRFDRTYGWLGNTIVEHWVL